MFKKFLPKNAFLRSVLTLMTGTGIAQALPIAISPILTRIYTPEDFGAFALFLAATSIVGIVSSGSYELAIVLPKTDNEAIHILLFSLAIVVFLSAVLLIVILLFGKEILTTLDRNYASAFWLYILPLSVISTGFYQCLNAWNTRKTQYLTMAKSRVTQSAITGLFQIFVVSGSASLIIGSLIGKFASIIIQSRYLTINFDRQSIQFSMMRKLMIRFIKFPAIQLPSSFIGVLSSSFPVLMLATFFGPTLSGFYALANRAVAAPLLLCSSSIGDVFRQQASRQYAQSGNVRSLFLKTARQLFVISLFVFIPLIFCAPELFALVFGEKWRVSGEYLQILAPMFWIGFIVSPLSIMFMIAEKQEYDLISKVILILLSALSLWVGAVVFNSVRVSLTLFSAVYCVKYVIEFYFSFRFTKNDRF